MASHKKTDSNEIVKTYSFKIKQTNNISIQTLKDAIKEYQTYYNLCSDWICKHLTTMKIGEMYNYVETNKQTNEYAKILITDEWKDKYMYNVFMKDYPSTHRDNILYLILSKEIQYNGNILNFSNSYYVRNGYISSVISNYATKLRTLKPNVKKHKLTEDCTNETLCEQTIYEIMHNGWTSGKDFDEYKDYLSLKTDVPQETIDRINTLSEYYKNHKEEINSKINTLTVDSLVKFGGCRRNENKQSMYIMGGNSSITLTKNNGNSFLFKFAKNINVELFGRKDVIKNGQLLVDVINNHGDSFVLKIVKDNIYLDINATLPFNKKTPTTNKIVGVDVNIKHMLLSTNIIDDGNVKGYTNIFKELIQDKEFTSVCNITTYENIKDFSKYVTFAPFEFEMLFSRIVTQRKYGNNDTIYANMEKAFTNTLNKLIKKFIECGDNKNRMYVQNVAKLRSQLKAYAVLKNVYYEQQSIYDTNKTEEYLNEYPFVTTEQAKNILNKLNNINEQIIGCRNNIICYAYNIFNDNAYDMIALEKLTSSQFEKIKTLPTLKSLLNYHKILGCTKEEITEKNVYNVIKKNYYKLIYDENNKVINAILTEKGKLEKIKTDFFNLMIKTLHFADIKDYFITLSNNGNVSVSLVPSFFTSQMDSKEHKIYCVNNEKTGKNKLKLVPKQVVRKTQEKHINGLNADYNAACNIAYIIENETWRDNFTTITNNKKSTYNKPAYDSKIKSQATVISKMKKMNAIHIMQ